MPVIPSEDFEQAILANWAAQFRCPVDTLLTPGATRLEARRYAGDRLVIFTYIAAHTFVEYDPQYGELLEQSAGRLGPEQTMSAVELVKLLGGDVFEGHDVNLIHYLYPPDLALRDPLPPFTVHRLTPADASAMSALHAACPAEEVDDGFVEVTHEAVFGCFDTSVQQGERLVAAASGYLRAGFVDIGVLTDPAYRRRGLGKLVVAALSQWAIEQGRIPQYRANTTNPGSIALARSLAFRLYFHSEVLWFAE